MPRCQISTHYRTWPCSACGQPMDPAHITTIDQLDVAVCAGCCPAKHKAEQRVTGKTSCFSTTNEASKQEESQPSEGGQR